MIVYKPENILKGKDMKNFIKIALLFTFFLPVGLFAADEEVEEVVVTGSQI